MTSDGNSNIGGSQRSLYTAKSPSNERSLSYFPPHQSTSDQPSPLSYSVSASLLPTGNSRHSNEQQIPLEQDARADQTKSDGVIQRFQFHTHNILSDQVTPLRLAGHLSVLAVAATILILSQIQIPKWDISLQSSSGNGDEIAEANQVVATGSQSTQATNDALQKAAVPFTIIPERGRTSIELYQVQSGDTVLGIAENHGLRPESIQWSNPSIELNPDLLRIGDRLRIPPVDGVLHTVTLGDTLSTLASKYKTSIDAVVGYPGNELTDASAPLVVGTEILIPGGTKPYKSEQVVAYSGPIPSTAVKGTGAFSWPTSGSITQRYWGGHPAIDVGSWTGASVKASDNGYVVVAGGGWNAGYGNHVIVDHGNGFVTLYAHLNSIFVRPGENISRGQQIGTVGNTGNSTGPHLHFEVRYQGVPQNPFGYLP